MPTRRSFLKGLTGSVLAGYIALPILEACTPTSVPLQPDANGSLVGPDGKVKVDVSDLTAANPAKVISGVNGPDSFGVMVTRVADGDYRALTMKCTHEACRVDDKLVRNEIHCSCHGSTFGLDGTVHTPPATVPLPQWPLEYDAAANVVHVKVRNI
jgi:Rieske Fe-S protein